MIYDVTLRQEDIIIKYLCFVCIRNKIKEHIVMDNPFEQIERRLDNIEKKVSDVVNMLQKKSSPILDTVIDERLVKIERAAEITGYKKGYLYELVCKNAIPYVRVNRSIRFDPVELDKWMRAGRPHILNNLIRNYG